MCLVWLKEIINDFRVKNHLILNQINFSQKIFQSIEVTESIAPVSTQHWGWPKPCAGRDPTEPMACPEKHL